MELYRELATQLEVIRQDERLRVWTDVGSSDLLPGLPNELVESLIWPRIRKHVEEVRQERHVQADIIGRLKLIRSLAQTSRKWRHLVRHSKPLGGFCLLMQGWAPNIWANFPDIISYHFISYMLYLPPLDIFYLASITFLTWWLNAWTYTFKPPQRDFYLELYLDIDDVCRCLRRWKELRRTAFLRGSIIPNETHSY